MSVLGNLIMSCVACGVFVYRAPSYCDPPRSEIGQTVKSIPFQPPALVADIAYPKHLAPTAGLWPQYWLAMFVAASVLSMLSVTDPSSLGELPCDAVAKAIAMTPFGRHYTPFCLHQDGSHAARS